MKRVVVTGGTGQIAYSLLFRIASGELFGPQEKIILHIRDLPDLMGALKGVVMELEDCAFPLLQEVRIGSDPLEIFREVDVAFLIGAKPRGPGMERQDLLVENGKIFIEEGKALNKVASRGVQVLVVGNPCNTNCLIAMNHAPDLPRKNFHAMMRLDQNRAQSLLARKSGVEVTDVSAVPIWGNHSSTQVPDFTNASIKGKKVLEVMSDRKWLEQEFFETIQKRGSAIIAAKGKSSAASAAHAALEAMKDLFRPTPAGHFFTSAVCSDENPYGIEKNLIFGFPCKSDGKGHYEIIKGLPWDPFIKERVLSTQKELIEERKIALT